MSSHSIEHFKSIIRSLKLNDSNLDLSKNEYLINKLIKSLAFASYKIEQDINKINSNATKNIIKILCPYYLQPIPSMSIVQFISNESSNNVEVIKKGTELIINLKDNNNYIFRTCYNILVNSFEVDDINYHIFNLESCLSIKLNKFNINEKHNLKKLRFFINLEAPLAYQIYELLFNQTKQIIIQVNDELKIHYEIPLRNLKSVGFMQEDNLLEFLDQCPAACKIMLEYFSLKEKFLFFDIYLTNNLKSIPINSKLTINVKFRSSKSHLVDSIVKQSLLLNCTPIINLFHQKAEPIIINHNKIEHEVIIPHYRNNNSNLSIHSLRDVDNFLPDQKIISHHTIKKHNNETKFYLSIIKKDSNKKEELIIQPKVLCCLNSINDNTASNMQKLELFFWKDHLSYIKKIDCLLPLTKPFFELNIDNKTDNLIEQISHNTIGLIKDKNIDSIKKILLGFNLKNEKNYNIFIFSITDLFLKNSRKQVIKENKIYELLGFDITLCINTHDIPHSEIFFLSHLFYHYLLRSISINTFIELTVKLNTSNDITIWHFNYPDNDHQ